MWPTLKVESLIDSAVRGEFLYKVQEINFEKNNFICYDFSHFLDAYRPTGSSL